MAKQEDVERLREIKNEIQERVDEALEIVRRSGNKLEYDRAKSYWHPHICMALGDEHDYPFCAKSVRKPY